METITFDSADLAVTEDFLSRAYARMGIGSSAPGTGRARVVRNGVPSAGVDELDLDFEMS
ncbi:hypothetical protein [Streptomyces collinus]|uniref:hypothetical protein n=1 Tax=Streptomyces collinus TaxID=42684 RepID=UPI0033D07E12